MILREPLKDTSNKAVLRVPQAPNPTSAARDEVCHLVGSSCPSRKYLSESHIILRSLLENSLESILGILWEENLDLSL